MLRAALFGLIAPSLAVAAPLTIAHQGRVVDANGAPVEGAASLRVRLYNAADGVQWEDTFENVPFQGGYFSVVLGTGVPLVRDDLLAGPVFLALKIGNAAEMPSRQQLHSAPYAIEAASVQLGAVTSCEEGDAGRLRWDGGLAVCDGNEWRSVRVGQDGSAGSPALSCVTLKAEFPAYPSDTYYLDPNGGSPADAFVAYCDMQTAGGGWTRVASVLGSSHVCSYEQALGTPQQVADGGAHAWLASSAVADMPFEDEIMIQTSDGAYTRYTSSHAAWSWAAVANGTINNNNQRGTYDVQYWQHNTSAFQPLGHSGASCVNNGNPCLLGGYTLNGSWGHILGIGSYDTGSYTQNSSCTAASSTHTGAASLGSWGFGATVYVR